MIVYYERERGVCTKHYCKFLVTQPLTLIMNISWRHVWELQAGPGEYDGS